MKKKIILILLSMIFYNLGIHHQNNNKKILTFGHRGASFDAPENTLAAIKKAFDLGADGVEVDIRMTADKKIIVLHDDTLKRIATYTFALKEKTGMSKEEFEIIIHTPIDKLVYENIRDIDIGLWKGKNWTEEKVPMLYDVLHFVLFSEKNRKKIQVEIKGKDIAIIYELKKALEKYPKKIVSESVILIGFDLKIMELAKKEIPYCTSLLVRRYEQIPTIYDIYKSIKEMIDADLDGIDFEANPKLITKEIVDKVHQSGKIIGIWVYPKQDTLENLNYFENLGIDFQTSNLPPEVVNHFLLSKTLETYPPCF